ncbi:DUF3526 domain-containing protein [Chitinophaga nivalis]|uniref:DUF3526 domain-containing protein n=1 Tax=Chitinophaga nivalis TaxID=2991709 RepID=A0ABT3III0_9BACT|nr:DUF3526 domain-containing protein [Chitinophaga nivalis]MCW3466699.1 DUF3526 domain-containing protein [Chitinophaga nivalis]MCW3483610.1 DUF3526 domain-containing protein [Chitinophaga nivalis]
MKQLYKRWQLTGRLLHFEWRWLLRTSILPVLLAVFTITGGYALFYGRAATVTRVAVIDSLQEDYQARFRKMHSGLEADTSVAAGKTAYQQATDPALVEYRLFSNSTHTPAAFALMAVGMSDIARYYYPVRIKTAYTPAEEKISNPQQLMTGNFDLAFMLIYLVPLMAIGLCYNLYAIEKEQGTLTLLLIQSGQVAGMLLVRLLMRYLVLLLLIGTLTVAGLLCLPAGIPVSLKDFLNWMLVAGAYTAFWAGLIWFVITWNRPAAANLVTLLGIWLLMLVILPAIFHFWLSREEKTDNIAVNAALQREIEWETWELPQHQLLDSFYHTFPQYRNAHAYDTGGTSMRRSMGYYQLAEERMNRVLAAQETAYRHSREVAAAAYVYNPAVYTQVLLNRIARTDAADYDFFREHTRTFRETWKHYMYQFYFNDRVFAPEDYANLPVYRPVTDTGTDQVLFRGIRYLLVGAIIWLVMGYLLLRQRQESI